MWNSVLLLSFYIFLLGPNLGSIGYLHIQSSGFWFVDLYRWPPGTVKCIFEEVLSKPGGGDQGIPKWQWNIQCLIVYVGYFKEVEKDKV